MAALGQTARAARPAAVAPQLRGLGQMAKQQNRNQCHPQPGARPSRCTKRHGGRSSQRRSALFRSWRWSDCHRSASLGLLPTNCRSKPRDIRSARNRAQKVIGERATFDLSAFDLAPGVGEITSVVQILQQIAPGRALALPVMPRPQPCSLRFREIPEQRPCPGFPLRQ